MLSFFRFSVTIYFEKQENIAISFSGGAVMDKTVSEMYQMEIGMLEKMIHLG